MSMTDIIERHEKLAPVPMPVGSTSACHRTASGAKIGFIASGSESFCSTDSRLRLTAKGKLRSCLMSEDGLDPRGVPCEHYPAILKKVMAMKPYERIESIDQPMHQIGG
jgi:cyclic pyranopterin phosphate synthase